MKNGCPILLREKPLLFPHCAKHMANTVCQISVVFLNVLQLQVHQQLLMVQFQPAELTTIDQVLFLVLWWCHSHVAEVCRP